MRIGFCALLLAYGSIVATRAEAPIHSQAAVASGRLEIVAAVVAPDLALRPVPKHRLRLIPDPGSESAGPIAEITTGFDGLAALEIPAGRYRMISVEPLRWEGALLAWEVAVEITAHVTTRVELSSDNAVRTVLRGAAGGDEANLFERTRPAVFLVEADTGHGSGFLIDAAGLVVTNYHVVGRARYVAVKLTTRQKYPAQVLALDRDHDVAVLRVNPAIVAGIAALPLSPARADDERLAVGQKVMAIGSPLTQEAVMTTGVVSKVQKDAIISDVNINPGNSGGPLLNYEGEVIGINTFGLGSGRGPGISGIVRIHLAETAIAEARGKAAASAPPPGTVLPVAPETPYPAALLRDMLSADADITDYQVESGKIDVQFLTPPLLHSLSKKAEMRAAEQQKKRRKKDQQDAYDPKDDFYEWRGEAGDYDPIVIIRAFPEIKMTGGSKAGLFFGALAGIVPPVRYRFKTDFREMHLYRGEQEVQPIHPGRNCEVVSQNQGIARMEDVGCFGVYQFPPDAFAPGATLTLKVYNEDRPDDPDVIRLESDLAGRIWTDLEPYFKHLEARKPPADPSGG